MTWKRLVVVLAGFIVFAFTAACSQPRPIPTGTDRMYYGHIEEGEKFGVSVGMSQEDTTLILSEYGAQDLCLRECNSYIAEIVGCTEEDRYHYFRFRAFLKDGSIYLRITEGKVAAIFWSFQLVRIDT